jgi:hypothetical protein
MFDLLREYSLLEGTCFVDRHCVFKGVKLGQWVRVQRTTKEKLSLERREKLNSIGFCWDLLSEKWEEGFSKLKKFHAREGHCLVPESFFEGDFDLKKWVRNQRVNRVNLSDYRINRLKSLGFSWTVLTDRWEEAFSLLNEYFVKEGNCLVDRSYTVKGVKLGQWVRVQRATKEKLSDERREKLNSVDFCWELLMEQWEEGFLRLKKFHTREGHCLVPEKFLDDEFKLGKWVGTQKQSRDKMNVERREKLEGLGFVWANSRTKT